MKTNPVLNPSATSNGIPKERSGWQCIVEYHNERLRVRLGFLNGALVYFRNDKIKRVSLKESVLVFARIEEMFLPDGSHDEATRAKWLRMVALAIR